MEDMMRELDSEQPGFKAKLEQLLKFQEESSKQVASTVETILGDI